jgi:RNA polymerase sigma factor (sigma-70 family)
MLDPTHDPFDPHTTRLIRSKARRLCRVAGFTSSDYDDLVQELELHLWRRLDRFNPAVAAWSTFASFVLDKRGISLARERSADKRCRRREQCSLNDPVLDEAGRLVERHQTTPEAASTRQRLNDLARDLADLREQLPSSTHRLFMDALARGGTVNSIGTELGLSRRAAARHFAELRQLFEDAGLRVYL